MGISQTFRNLVQANNLQEINSTQKDRISQLEKINSDLNDKISSLKKDYCNLSNEQYNLEKRINQLNKEYENVVQQISKYKTQFGYIKEPKSYIVNEYDVDRIFFDRLTKLMGNPFNCEQVSAIRYDMKKNLRIIAGAGSGKTQTICAKAAYLAQMENIDESRIMMITFTRKAANELEARVKTFLGKSSTDITVGTFHSVFNQLFNSALKVPEFNFLNKFDNFKDNIEDSVKKNVIRNLVNKYNLRAFDQEGEKVLTEKLDYWFSMDLSEEEILTLIENNYDNLEADSEDLKIHERVKLLLDDFTEFKRKEKVREFSDMLNNFKQVIQYQEIRDYVTCRFDYLFIDEFQDTNPIQWNVVKEICKNTVNGKQIKLIIVGDDDQSIYHFRGAEPKYIKEFDQEFETNTIELMTNYRSKANIVQAANRLITKNFSDRIEKSMTPASNEDGEVAIKIPSDSDSEAEWIINKAIKLSNGNKFCGSNEPDLTKSVVLYRSINQVNTLIKTLIQKQIDFVIESDEEFKGIFDLTHFKDFFLGLKSIYEADNDIEREFRQSALIDRLLYLFYMKGEHKNDFKKLSLLKKGTNEAAAFIVKNVRRVYMHETEIARLLGLIQTKTNNDNADISELFELFIKVSKVRSELSEGERDWIIEDTKKFPTWNDLKNYYDSCTNFSKEMKEKVKQYHDGELNALYLLTIHKSKGLDFENVFIPSCSEGGLPNQKAVSRKASKTVKVSIRNRDL